MDEGATYYGPLMIEDVDAMVGGLSQGVYTSQRMYESYAEIARGAGRYPAHPVVLGRELTRRGFRRTRKLDKSRGTSGYRVKAWFVPGDAPMLARQAATSSAGQVSPVSPTVSDSCDQCSLPLGEGSKRYGRCFTCRARYGDTPSTAS